MFTMNDLFEIAVKMEKNGNTTYTRSIEKVENRELKSLLQWMADEESAHAKWFTQRQAGLSIAGQEADLKEMVPNVLQDMMGENTLSLDEIDFKAFTTVSQLLEAFIGFEEETIQFYELLEMFIDDESVKKGLATIIDEEKKHVKQLGTMLDSVSDHSF